MIKGDRPQIFASRLVSHRGHEVVDTASSKSYLQFLHQLSEEKSRVAIVPPDMEGRPDLLSYAAYGTELLWWLIVQANNISDYEEDLAAGKQIKIPII